MNLKYVCKNDGYIIDRKLNNEAPEGVNTFTTKGNMILTELLPENEEMKKSIAEFAFDSMKQNVLDTYKKKYSLSDEELVNFYFEGKIENNAGKVCFIKYNDEEIPVIESNFNLNFEVEAKVNKKNFIKVQYDNLKFRLNSVG